METSEGEASVRYTAHSLSLSGEPLIVVALGYQTRKVYAI